MFDRTCLLYFVERLGQFRDVCLHSAIDVFRSPAEMCVAKLAGDTRASKL